MPTTDWDYAVDEIAFVLVLLIFPEDGIINQTYEGLSQQLGQESWTKVPPIGLKFKIA